MTIIPCDWKSAVLVAQGKWLVNPVHRWWRGEVLQLVGLTSSSGWWPPVVDLSVVISHGWLLGLQRQQLSQCECGGAYLTGGAWLWSDERQSLPAHPSGYEGKVSPQLSWLSLPGRIKCERHSIWHRCCSGSSQRWEVSVSAADH